MEVVLGAEGKKDIIVAEHHTEVGMEEILLLLHLLYLGLLVVLLMEVEIMVVEAVLLLLVLQEQALHLLPLL